MLLDLAQHYNGAPVNLGDIAKRQNISLKYLEQIIRPLKKSNYMLEGGAAITRCSESPDACERVDDCVTRYLWVEASKAIFERLSTITFADLMALEKSECKDKFLNFISSHEETAYNTAGS
jgi:DNA-binding IscR family transcriptional regulator